MKIPIELLKLKNINPLQKLILGLIIDTPPIILQFAGGYDKTCGEMGKVLGVSRLRIKKEVEELMEHDYITSRKGNGWRTTNIAPRLEKVLK